MPLRLLSTLPVLHDQIDGIRRIADVTAELGATGARAARRIDPKLSQAGAPAGRIALLDVALEEIDRIDAQLRNVDLRRPPGLLPPLQQAHEDLASSVVRARSKLQDGRALVVPVRELLAGPSSLLLLAANNAEMAGGAGLALSAGVLTFDQGEIELGDVIPASDLRLPASVPLPGDIGEIYRPTGVGIDIRSTTRSPNLAVMGPVALAMMAARGITDLDGVVVVDALALKDVLRVTGGVTVAGRKISAHNVLAQVLHESYREFQTVEERPERVSLQGDIAKAVFASLTDRSIAAADLADALLTASKGRHVMLWSARSELESVWEKLGIAGALSDRGLMISFQNYGADKMDWYLRPRAAMQVRLLPSGDYRARLTMSVRVPANAELRDASLYILGPGPDKHGLFLTVHLPSAAYDVMTPNTSKFATEGIDPPMQVRTFLENVRAGTTFRRELEFSLPRSASSLVLLPSARMVPLPLTIDDAVATNDAVARPITWSVADPGDPPGASASLWVKGSALAGLLMSQLASASALVAVLRRRRNEPMARSIDVARRAAISALGCFVLTGLLALVVAR